MSVVVTPPSLNHSPFSENDIYTTSSPSSSSHDRSPSPPSSPSPSVASASDNRTLVPLPSFQHRHTSPFPMSHSFSALGPPPATSPPRPTDVLASIPPPPAPKTATSSLPCLPTMNLPEGAEMVVQTFPTTLPPTPDPSPPNSKVIFPDAMIKLAPPAVEQDGLTAVQRSSDETPRRIPLIDVEGLTDVMAPPANVIRSKSGSGREALSTRPKSMGPPSRPMRRSQTANNPNSIRMGDSRNTDPRAKSIASAMSPRQNSSGQLMLGRTDSPGMSRTLTSPVSDVVKSSRSSSAESASPDLGGSDGLEAKVVLLGSQGVGKTSLIIRYTTRTFSPTPAAATIGSSLHTRKLVQDGVRVKLQIWDTAGQERFRSMAPIYYRGAHVCVLVYDISDRQSFEDVRSWLEELGRTVPKETVIYVVGSKVDLDRQRVITPSQAHSAIRTWVRPPPGPAPEMLRPPPSRSLFRSSSSTSRESQTPNTSGMASPTPTRSQSHTALTGLNVSSGSNVIYNASIPAPRTASDLDSTASNSAEPAKTAYKLFPGSPQTRPSTLTRSETARDTRPSALKIATVKHGSPDPSIAPRARKLSFPALQSPTLPTSVTFTEPIKPSITPASPTSRHGVSGGRFSISGVLGYSRTVSTGGAASNLARLAEDFPKSPQSPPSSNPSLRSYSFGSDLPPPRIRIESSPLLENRRKSEDWSSRPWRMGEGPGAAEALGEFGAGVKKKQSGELLGNKASTIPITASKSRARAGSLGRDSRLYGVGSGSEASEDDVMWGVDVEGMRVGEVSALNGEGVEALFRSISAVLVEKREKIERERTLRRKDSVMLADPARTAKEAKAKTRGCCV